jgi:hypothetical protein
LPLRSTLIGLMLWMFSGSLGGLLFVLAVIVMGAAR